MSICPCTYMFYISTPIRTILCKKINTVTKYTVPLIEVICKLVNVYYFLLYICPLICISCVVTQIQTCSCMRSHIPIRHNAPIHPIDWGHMHNDTGVDMLLSICPCISILYTINQIKTTLCQMMYILIRHTMSINQNHLYSDTAMWYVIVHMSMCMGFFHCYSKQAIFLHEELYTHKVYCAKKPQSLCPWVQRYSLGVR